jgi:hypothetical protein
LDIIKFIKPEIQKELIISRLGYGYKEFKKKILLLFLVFGIGITIMIGFGILLKIINFILAIVIWFIFLIILFLIIINIPKIQINSIAINVEKDMLQISRRFLINIQSGMSIFASYVDLAKTDLYVAKFFDEIVSKIYLGMPMEQTIKEAGRLNPSKNFKKMQNQVLSALLTGSNIEKVFQVTLEGMVKDYIIQIKNYGKQLGAIAMIYMIFGTIIPSIACVFIIIIISLFLSDISNIFFIGLYIGLSFMLLFIQFIFIRIFKATKPKISI